MIERTESLSWEKGGVWGYINDGLLHAQQVDPAEMSAGAFSYRQIPGQGGGDQSGAD